MQPLFVCSANFLNHFQKLFPSQETNLDVSARCQQDKDHGTLPKPPLQNVPLNPTVRKQQNNQRDALNIPWSDPDALL